MAVRRIIAAGAVSGLVLAAPVFTFAQDVTDASAHHRAGINARERGRRRGSKTAGRTANSRAASWTGCEGTSGHQSGGARVPDAQAMD